MSARIQQLDIKIGGDNAGGVQALDQTEKKVDSLAMKMKAFMSERRASGEAATARVFGGSGERALEYLFGGGAKLAITAFAMRELANMTENAAQHMEKLRAGTESVGDALIGIAKGIPLIGEAIKAGEGLGKLIRLSFGFEDPEEMLKEAEATAKKVEDRLAFFRKRENEHTLVNLAGIEKQKEELRQRLTSTSEENEKQRQADLSELAKKEAKARKEIEDNSRSYAGGAGTGAYESPQSIQVRQEATEKAERELVRFATERQAINLRYFKLDETTRGDHNRQVATIDREAQKRLNENTLKSMDETINHWAEHRKKIIDGEKPHWDQLARIGEAELKKQGERVRQRMEDNLAESRGQSDVEGELARFKIDSAMEKGNQLEAERLTVAEQYRQKREEILKLLQDENATAAQKVRASRLGDELDGREAAALRRLNSGSKATGFGFESAHFLTGVTGKDAPGEQLKDVAKNTADVPPLLQKVADKLDDIFKAFSAKPKSTTYSGN